MNIKFYNCNDDRRKIRKNLIQVGTTVSCKVKEQCSCMKPSFIVGVSSMPNIKQINYCYVDTYDRYYFIDEITNETGQRIVVNCSVDVLNSFKEQILNCEAVISKQTSEINSNKYIDDGSFVTLTKETNETLSFPNGFSEEGRFILITAGG